VLPPPHLPLSHACAQSLVVKAHGAVNVTGEGKIKTMEELVKLRQIQRNILVAIDALTNCLPVIKLFGKANSQMASKRYYPMLRTLQELETTRLPTVAQYPFAAKIRCPVHSSSSFPPRLSPAHPVTFVASGFQPCASKSNKLRLPSCRAFLATSATGRVKLAKLLLFKFAAPSLRSLFFS
jgi:hypothetical protein